MSFPVAKSCPISTATIHNVLQQYICLDDSMPGYDHHNDRLTIDSRTLVAAWTAGTNDYLARTYDIALTKSLVHIKDDNYVDVETDTHTGKPAFLFAVCLALLMYVSGKDMVIVVPVAQMGIPGTSLTMRRAFRCLLHSHNHWSVDGLLATMETLGESLAD